MRLISTLQFFAPILLLIAAATVAPACKPPPVPPATSLVVRARADSGAAVSNVEIVSAGALVAKTDHEGRARLDVLGAEGSTYDLEIRCPAGYRSPAEPLAVRRLSIEGTPNQPEYAITCQTTRRHLIVAVRADGGGAGTAANLPIVYMGKKIGQTDRSGAAHVLVDAEAHEHVDLMIDTSGVKDAEKIHPKNPTASFDVNDRDEVQLFDVMFTRDAVKKRVVAAPKKTGPVAM